MLINKDYKFAQRIPTIRN